MAANYYWAVMEVHAYRRRERCMGSYQRKRQAEDARDGYTRQAMGYPLVYYVCRVRLGETSPGLPESSLLEQIGELPDLPGQSGGNP